MKKKVQVWGPATIANWGPGFDLLGAAVTGLGDRVIAEYHPEGKDQVVIEEIRGDGGKLPLNPGENTAGIAALAVKKHLELKGTIALSLDKGLPIGSGLGSSAASAAAAAHALNLLAGSPLSPEQLLPFALEAEAKVSGRHADNLAPALMGGFVLISSLSPLRIFKFEPPENLYLTLIRTEQSIKTKYARSILPKEIPFQSWLEHSKNLSLLLEALHRKDLLLLSESLRDQIIEPVRAKLIRGYREAKEASLEAGALAFSISGSGPTLFAVSPSEKIAEDVCTLVAKRLSPLNLSPKPIVCRVDSKGARTI